MKRVPTLALLLLFGVSLTLPGCKKKESVPIKEVIAKKWTAQQVDENNVVYYTKGGATNIRPGYAQFLLDLSSPTAVTYREFDANSFTGTWAVSADETKLTLSGLTPQPTDSGGTLEFTINEATDTRLVLTRLTASPKTGATTNKYTLSNP